MPNKAFNYDFRLYLEGVLTPFISANIICTPNGAEANINLFATRTAYNIKPKTSVQIFYKDWVNVDGKKGWRLMFDGYHSSYVKNDEALQGRGLGIVCRDFRMDIRKAPAALVHLPEGKITKKHEYHKNGIHQKAVAFGLSQADTDPEKQKGTEITVFTGQLIRLGDAISYIAGRAFGRGTKPDPERPRERILGKGYGGIQERGSGKGEGAFFLDSVVRGIWMDAVGGTSASAFMNKRIRIEKKLVVAKNKTGYNFWSRNNVGLFAGSALLSGSMFTSVEAAIVRLAGLFSIRIYSCSTPSLIDIEKDEVSDWIMHKDVKDFLVNRGSAEFGAKYILNEWMFLPPMEFTAPPNCNLIFPPMCDRIAWQYDMDGDYTRGHFHQVDFLSSKAGSDIGSISFQIPTALFNAKDEAGKKLNKKDRFSRRIPPLTLEERYKGVNAYYSSVELALGAEDAAKTVVEQVVKEQALSYYEDRKKILEAKELAKDTKKAAKNVKQSMSKLDFEAVQEEITRLGNKITTIKNAKKKRGEKSRTVEALERHALIKFLNLKYAGRVAVVDMQFNPYIMCGFPGAVISDNLEFAQSTKTIVGMVQQVKHLISISSQGGQASTTVILNNARFSDESTDMDDTGNPYYMKETNRDAAEVDPVTFEFKDPAYYVPEPKSFTVASKKDDKYYDLEETTVGRENSEYKYAKDFLTLPLKNAERGERNTVYLDKEYEPNRIARFYKLVFKHHSPHFMIGTDSSVDQRSISFAFDTMDEAFRNLNDTKMMDDYEECMRFIHRDVCSADAFFQGIMGLSIQERIDGDVIYTNISENFQSDRIMKKYWGLSTDAWDTPSISEGLKTKEASDSGKSSGHMTGPGQFSSIRETMPITAFLKEKRDAVIEYLQDVFKHTHGEQFANLDE